MSISILYPSMVTLLTRLYYVWCLLIVTAGKILAFCGPHSKSTQSGMYLGSSVKGEGDVGWDAGGCQAHFASELEASKKIRSTSLAKDLAVEARRTSSSVPV